MAQTNNFSGLTEYVGTQRDALSVKASTEAKSLKYFDLFLGIKHKDIIPAMNNTVVLGDGSACGWNPDGSDIINEIPLEVNPAEVEKEFCQRDFEKTWANYQLRWEAGREALPFEESFVNGNISATQEALEDDLWSSGTTAYGMTGITALLEAPPRPSSRRWTLWWPLCLPMRTSTVTTAKSTSSSERTTSPPM